MTWDEGSPVIGRIFSEEYASLFGPPRVEGGLLTDRERDIAASLQTVSRDVSPRYHQLISDFGELTGVPVVLNT